MNDVCEHVGQRTSTTTIGDEIRRMEWCNDCGEMLHDTSCPTPSPDQSAKLVQPPKWTLEDGLALVRKHQDAAFKLGYNLSLGGGVLNKGESKHDLDIVCAPAKGRNGTKDDYLAFAAWLRSISNASLDLAPETGSYWNGMMRRLEFFDEYGRKIDWFVVCSL